MGMTLGRLLQTLGPAAFDVLATPQGLEIEVAEPAVLDVAEGVRVEPHALLLAVGIRGSDQAIVGILEAAAEQGASAVIVKEPGPELANQAKLADIAVLVVDEAMSWRHLDSLLTAATDPATGASGGSNGSLSGGVVGDLFALANSIAAIVGGAISIEDPQRRILAYSNLDNQIIDAQRQAGILGRKVPDLPGINDLYVQLQKNTEVLRFDDPAAGASPRVAVAVRAAGEVLGSIWALEGDKPLGEESKAALADAARIAALHLLRARNAEDVSRRQRAEMLESLLAGDRSSGVAARRLGLDLNDRAHIVGFAIVGTGEEDEATAGAIADRVVDLITVYCEAFRRRAACAAVGPVIYALLPAIDGSRRLDALGRDVVGRAEKALGVRVLAAVSTEARRIDDLPVLRTEVDRALAVLSQEDESRQVVTVDEVRNQSILLELGRILAARPDLENVSLRAMRAVDTDKGSAHVATLRAYFDALGDVIVAAERISVHQNTFRYRLRRVSEVFDVDLADPDTRLLLWLQLRTLSS